MSMIKVSDYVIKFIESLGVKDVFVISGGGLIHLLDSLGRSNLNYICNHHEQALAMAVEGYSRISNNVGVGLVTTGPGGSNTLTGVLGCWLDSIPAVFISGQVQINQLSEGTGCRQVGDQEFNISKLMSHVTKYSKIVKNKDDIKLELQLAIIKATSGRPGPVWLDIPLDIQASEIDESELVGYCESDEILKPSDEEVIHVISKLKLAKKPLLVLGSGIRLSHSEKLLKSFLSKTGIPVVTGAHSAVDIVNESYPYYAGRIGVLGQRTSNVILQEADLVLVLGSRLSVKMTGYKFEEFAKNAYKVIVDIDSNEMEKFNVKADYKIRSDLKRFFVIMENYRLDDLDISEWQKYCCDLRDREQFVFPKHRALTSHASNYCFIEELSHYLDGRMPVVTSNGSAHVITQQTARMRGSQRLFTNVGCASMGYGLPAAIGACIANDRKPVICIEGDGSLQMNIQELQTLIHYNLPIKLFVINNDMYLSIKNTQDSFFNSHYVGVNKHSGVSAPDLRKIAEAYGIRYLSIENNSEIGEGIRNTLSLEQEGPTICEVFTYPEERHEPKVEAVLKEDGTFEPGDLTNMKITEGFYRV